MYYPSVETRREALRTFLSEHTDGRLGGYVDPEEKPLIRMADFWASEDEGSAESDERWLVLTETERNDLDPFINKHHEGAYDKTDEEGEGFYFIRLF